MILYFAVVVGFGADVFVVDDLASDASITFASACEFALSVDAEVIDDAVKPGFESGAAFEVGDFMKHLDEGILADFFGVEFALQHALAGVEHEWLVAAQ